MTKNDIIITKITQSSKDRVANFRDFSESFAEDLKKSKKNVFEIEFLFFYFYFF